jgi:rSAM/selenodomain-associated transferase 2
MYNGHMNTAPELSIITPVLDEEKTLPSLFSCLAEQEGVLFELILCDGGSRDGTKELANALGKEAPFQAKVISAEKGRGPQMNAGTAAGSGSTFLFLHADSRFKDRLALRSALDQLDRETATSENERVAGRFSLRFDRHGPSLPYYYFESKARLDRPGCTHGDQGFMLRRSFFSEAGPFDNTYPMLAESRFAEAVRSKGRWLLFPAEIFTSARRFELDGLYARQALNAIIMNFADQGWETFFRELPAIYQGNERREGLQLLSVLREIDRLIALLPLKERIALWYATGRYVRSHAWQIPFFIDTARNFRAGLPPGHGKRRLLAIHDRFLEPITDNHPGRLIAALLTWLWFRLELRSHP